GNCADRHFRFRLHSRHNDQRRFRSAGGRRLRPSRGEPVDLIRSEGGVGSDEQENSCSYRPSELTAPVDPLRQKKPHTLLRPLKRVAFLLRNLVGLSFFGTARESFRRERIRQPFVMSVVAYLALEFA